MLDLHTADIMTIELVNAVNEGTQGMLGQGEVPEAQTLRSSVIS